MSYPDEYDAHASGIPSGFPVPDVSPRERQLLILLTNGRTISEAARAMHVGEGTAKNTLSRAYQRLGVQSLVGAYDRLGWIVVK